MNLRVVADSPEGRDLLPDPEQEASLLVLGNRQRQRSHRAWLSHILLLLLAW